jgi:hypothetical protein
VTPMSDDADSDFRQEPPAFPDPDLLGNRADWLQFCRSSLDLLNRMPLLCGDALNGVPVELPNGQRLPDSSSPTGWLMSPTPDATSVARSGQLLGSMLGVMSRKPEAALTLVAAWLGLSLGHGGKFDYQREGNSITGFVQYRQFRDVSNFNIGLLAQQAGLPEEFVLFAAGLYARLLSSNARPDLPYGQEKQNVMMINLGYKVGMSHVFNRPKIP